MKKRLVYRAGVVLLFVLCPVLLGGCLHPYYAAMEKVGIHKRDIMVDRVEAARDAQQEAQEQFKSALEQFDSVVKLEETNLKKAYEDLNSEYEASEAAAEKVTSRIRKVESVADALFDEWEDEITLYHNKDLQRASKTQLRKTQARYAKMLHSMHQAEASMGPVLSIFLDNVLFLKHNLNAQAIGSLQGEFASLKGEIESLISKMNIAIESSNTFIADIRK